MGDRGFPPKPVVLKLMEGTSHHPIPQDTAANAVLATLETAHALPVCPEWLDDGAQEEWNELTSIMGKIPGWLTQVNKTTLAGHCQWYSTWVEAEKVLQKEGRTYQTVLGQDEEGNLAVVKKIHPMVRVAKEAWIAMIKCDQELGITPARGSAVRLPVGEHSDESGLDHPGRTG